MFKSRNNRGFTLAELAATLGVFALAATILTPAFSGVPAISNSNVTVSSDSPAGASPFTPPVQAILVDVTNDATGVTVQKVVSDPNATSTTISNLDPQASYTVAVAKQNQVGKSPAAVAQISYGKTGEYTRYFTQPEAQTDTSNPIYVNGAAKYRNGAAIYTNGAATAWEQKIASYGTKVISVGAYQNRHTSPVYENVQRSRQVRVAPYERYVSASNYNYSCTKYRTVSEACGTESYTYSSTCSRTYNYSCTKSYSCTKYACANNKCPYTSTCSYQSTCSATESYSCTKTGTRTKYCNVQEAYTGTCTGTTPGYYETVYNYNTEYYTENVQTGTQTFYASVAEGSCAANGTTGSWTGVVYACSDTSMNKTVTDYNKPNYVNDTSKPIAWQQVFQGYQQIFDGHEQVFSHYGTKMVDVAKSEVVSQYGTIPGAKSISAQSGQLVLSANKVWVSGNKYSSTVVASGSAKYPVGSTVKFTGGRLAPQNNVNYITIDAAKVIK